LLNFTALQDTRLFMLFLFNFILVSGLVSSR